MGGTTLEDRATVQGSIKAIDPVVTEIFDVDEESDSPGRKRPKISNSANSSPEDNAVESTVSNNVAPEDGPSKKKSSTKQQDKEDMAWICAECKEAECGLVSTQSSEQKDTDGEHSFLICDGPCRRIFHLPCAGLNQLPPSDEDWVCKDCLRKVHACAYCQLPGVDYVDVFPCQDDLCGLFFHEACLETHQVDYSYRKTPSAVVQDEKTNNDEYEGDGDDDEEEITQIPTFTCPAHHCWTCTQKDMIQMEKDEEVRERRENSKKKRKKKKQSIFQSKNGRLYQCLYCPRAYHVTCIPHTARFHELAVLCHEHANTHRLPVLDMNCSIQSQLEEKVDKTLMKLHGIGRRASTKKGLLFGRRAMAANPFFPGLHGDRYDSMEMKLLQTMKDKALERSDSQSNPTSETVSVNPASALLMAIDGSLPFCLPVDIKDEVYSKPPPYTHIQSLKYDENKYRRPKKIPFTSKDDREKCSCTGEWCGDDCLNRLTMAECVGPINCNLGGKDCGNRGLSKRQFVRCQPKRERGKGWGLVSLEFVPKGKLVQEYVGEVIDEKEKEKRLIEWNEEHPNDPNFYVMALSTGFYVDAREYANLARFINHSCDPNCRVASVNVKGYIRNGIYSIRDIQPGEFLSYDYHFDTRHGDRFVCRCGATNCRGTMKGTEKDGTLKKPTNWKEAKARYDMDKKFLDEVKGTDVLSLIDTLLPCADHPNQTIAAGPPEKHKQDAINGRIFLWRNVKWGADFVSRYSRLEKKAGASCFVFGHEKTSP